MSLPEIKALPVASWAASDAVLFLWTTDPMLRHAMDVIEAWGFTYKTVAFYWVKLNKGRGGIFLSRDFFTGMGFWTRANPEPCLLATTRQAEAPRHRCRQAADRGAARAFAQAGRDLRAHRAPGRWPLSRAVRARLAARLGRLGNQAGLFDQGPVRTRRRPSRGPAPRYSGLTRAGRRLPPIALRDASSARS